MRMKRPQGYKTKRTRPIRGDYFLTIPRITHAGRILEIKVKLSQVIITDLGPAKKRSSPGAEEIAGRREPNTSDSTGEIERGSIDGKEEHESTDTNHSSRT